MAYAQPAKGKSEVVGKRPSRLRRWTHILLKLSLVLIFLIGLIWVSADQYSRYRWRIEEAYWLAVVGPEAPPPPTMPEEENAAIFLDRAADALPILNEEEEELLKNPALASDEELLELANKLAPALKLMEEAAKKEACRWPSWAEYVGAPVGDPDMDDGIKFAEAISRHYYPYPGDITQLGRSVILSAELMSRNGEDNDKIDATMRIWWRFLQCLSQSADATAHFAIATAYKYYFIFLQNGPSGRLEVWAEYAQLAADALLEEEFIKGEIEFSRTTWRTMLFYEENPIEGAPFPFLFRPYFRLVTAGALRRTANWLELQKDGLEPPPDYPWIYPLINSDLGDLFPMNKMMRILRRIDARMSLAVLGLRIAAQQAEIRALPPEIRYHKTDTGFNLETTAPDAEGKIVKFEVKNR